MRTRVRYGQREIKRISRTATLGGLFISFLKIGLVGFGGSLAVIAQVRTLTVQNRRWLTDLEFAEGFALAQSLPGTSAGNVATYVGLKLRGWRGASLALTGFILPSFLMMIVLAILYRHLRYLPNTERLFHGFNAAMVSIIAVTAWRMGKNTLGHRWQWIVGLLACLAVVILEATVIEVVLASGIVGIFIGSLGERPQQVWHRVLTASSRRRRRIAGRLTSRRRGVGASGSVRNSLARVFTNDPVLQAVKADEPSPGEAADSDSAGGPSLRSHALGVMVLAMPIMAKLGLLLTVGTVFLRMGAITFGGGFAMIPLIESEAVDSHHWLTHQEFADATALGQITPGPILITATFIGYRVAGTLGALVATISIFLPSFLMTISAGSSLRRFRNNELVQSFLRGVTPAVVGLLVAAAWSLGLSGIHTGIGFLLAIAAAIVLIRFRPNPFWVILGAGLLRFGLGVVLW